MSAFLFAFASFVSTFLGGLFGIRYREKLHLIISFTAGVLIGVTFFDIVPEIFAEVSRSGLDPTPALTALVLGFLVIHILEKVAVIHTPHEEEYAEHRHPLVGYIGAGGLTLHSFLDGVGIGLGFHVSYHVGIIVAIAVIAHDFSDGLNTVSLMLLNRNTIGKAVWLLLADATAPLLGVLATYLFQIPRSFLVLYLGFFAGFLLYIGASDLLPEAHSKHSSFRLIFLTIFGILFVFLISRFV